MGVTTSDTLMSMKYTSARLISNMVATICHVIMIIYFVYSLDWGFDGVCIATSIHFFIRFFVVYM